MIGKPKEQGELAKRLMAEYPTAGNLTLAKRLHRDNPDVFKSVEVARTCIRYYKGVCGDRLRSALADTTHVADKEALLSERLSLAPSAVMSREAFVLPKVNDRIIVFGDCHFPYQNNEAILAALAYAQKKQVNTLILNGDMLDFYGISKFTKNDRKPNIEYECELFYEFLIQLRDLFPKALIVWKYGNHEERWDSYLKGAAPLLYMIGTEALEDYLPVRDLNIHVIKDKRRIVAGDLNILHGHEFWGSSGQVNPARTMFLKARTNVLVNHFHRSSAHKGNDLNGTQIRAYSLGAMCGVQDYSPYGDQDCSFGYLVTIDGQTWVQVREV